MLFTRSKSATKVQSYSDRTTRTNHHQYKTKEFNLFTLPTNKFYANENSHQKRNHRLNSQRLFNVIPQKSTILDHRFDISKQIQRHSSNKLIRPHSNSTTPKMHIPQVPSTFFHKRQNSSSENLDKLQIRQIMKLQSLEIANQVTNSQVQTSTQSNYFERKQNIINQLSEETNRIILTIEGRGKRDSLQFELNNTKSWQRFRRYGNKQKSFRVDLSQSMKSASGFVKKIKQETKQHDPMMITKKQVFSSQVTEKSIVLNQYIQPKIQQEKKKQAGKVSIEQRKIEQLKIESPKSKQPQIKQLQVEYVEQIKNSNISKHNETQLSSQLFTDYKKSTVEQKLPQPPTISKKLQYSESQMSFEEIKLDQIPLVESRQKIAPNQVNVNQKSKAHVQQKKQKKDVPIREQPPPTVTVTKPAGESKVVQLNQQNNKPPQQNKRSLKIQQQLQHLNSIGQIVGRGLKMMKDININWILPCLPIYQKFYQLRCKILQKDTQKDSQFLTQMLKQNQIITESFNKMVKSALKKEVPPSKITQVKQLKISTKVSYQQIFDEVDQYVEVVNEFEGTQAQQNIIKNHLALIINSVIKLGNLGISPQEQVAYINPDSKDINNELEEGLNRMYNFMN